MTGTVKIDDSPIDLIDVSLIGSYSLTKTIFQNPSAGILFKTGINHRTGERILAQVHTKSTRTDPKNHWPKVSGSMVVVDKIDSEFFDVVVMRFDGDLVELERWMATQSVCSSRSCEASSEATTQGGDPATPTSTVFEASFLSSPKLGSSASPPFLSSALPITSSDASTTETTPSQSPSSPSSALARLSPRNLAKSFDLLRRCKKVAPVA